MAQYSRNDPSSLSFGRRLARAELDASQAKQELAQLKKDLPSSQQLQGAALSAEVIKVQRKTAKQMLADSTTSLEDLNTIDPAVLTPAYREQLRLNKKDAAWRELTPAVPHFSFDQVAQQRFVNWQQQTAIQPRAQQDFAASNFTPEELTPFQRWDQRQKSLAGRKWNAEQNRAEYEQGLMLRRSEAQRNKPKGKGKRLGGLKDLNE